MPQSRHRAQKSSVNLQNLSNFDLGQMKESLLGKQTLIKNKNSISRHCMSADIKKEQRNVELPQKVKEFRRSLHRKKSKDSLSQVDQAPKSIPILLQAQRMAYEGRKKVQK